MRNAINLTCPSIPKARMRDAHKTDADRLLRRFYAKRYLVKDIFNIAIGEDDRWPARSIPTG